MGSPVMGGWEQTFFDLAWKKKTINVYTITFNVTNQNIDHHSLLSVLVSWSDQFLMI
jgi:hypothetical protein